MFQSDIASVIGRC